MQLGLALSNHTANARQAVFTFRLSPKTGLDRITVLDATFAVLDAAVVIARLWENYMELVVVQYRY